MNRDIDALPGERWFPDATDFAAEIEENWGPWGVASEVAPLKAVLMRRPGPEIDNFSYQEVRFREEVSPEKMWADHDRLTGCYRDFGVEVFYVQKQRADRPNAFFMRDLMFMTPEGAIIGRPAIKARRGEERYVAQALAELGVPILKTINGRGYFEGANAMWVDRRTVILASGSRANQEGLNQVKLELERQGVDNFIFMQIPYGHAHIDGILNMAREDLAMVHAPQVPFDVCAALQERDIKVIEAPSRNEAKETMGINFVAIRPNLVVQPAGNPRCREELEKNGVKVIAINVDELLKGWGGIHCATAFLRRE